MKKVFTLATLVLCFLSNGQGFEEKIALPLSSPGDRGKLEIGLVRGDIKIEAYDGKEVIIEATAPDKKEDCSSCPSHDHATEVPAGMKRISSSPIELEASENNNDVEIETNSWKKTINLSIKIPSNFDLNLSTVYGSVKVTAIDGSHEISSVNGPISLIDIAGSVVSNTVNGNILANFKEIKPNEPMSFVTLNGNVDITFPSNTKAKAKMRSDQGEIFTDFDMSMSRPKPEIQTNEGAYKVSVNSWVYGEMNGGGPEYTFKNMHGNIIIRQE